MNHDNKYHLGLLYLVHLLINADGVIEAKERAALLSIKNFEKIPDSVFNEFEGNVATLKERDIYHLGLEYINECSTEEKLNAFVHLYKMSEADGRVHVKEVRLMLYSVRQAGIEFDDVVKRATQTKS